MILAVYASTSIGLQNAITRLSMAVHASSSNILRWLGFVLLLLYGLYPSVSVALPASILATVITDADTSPIDMRAAIPVSIPRDHYVSRSLEKIGLIMGTLGFLMVFAVLLVVVGGVLWWKCGGAKRLKEKVTANVSSKFVG